MSEWLVGFFMIDMGTNAEDLCAKKAEDQTAYGLFQLEELLKARMRMANFGL